ncbi:MAG TPA: protein phosphatase 2C domain-containing protein [Polyangiaceae bacterium]|nr:protein phosphatase 2C domain-containing protein [Polyangiaceae bacterium]
MEPAHALPAVEFAQRSDPGRDPDKQINEDASGHRETRFGHLCVVCDGMGGHASGREAAELALATIFDVVDHMPDGTPAPQVLRAAIEEASRRVYAMPTSEIALGRPGSTVVALLMHAGGVEVCHVGDSRAYLVHEGQVFRVTRDHSVVQELVDRGVLTLQQAAHHPDANRITRALGMSAEVEVELRPQPVPYVTGDAFVLCSDGLSDLVEDHEILATVGSEPGAQAVGKLVDLANARGGHDNITVVVLRARENSQPLSGGVAPTVAQTSQGPTTVPSGPPGFTAAPGDRSTQPALAGVSPGFGQRPLEPTPPPPSTRTIVSEGGAPPMVVAGIFLAGVATALLVTVLAVHFAERGGKRNAAHDTTPLASAVDAMTDGPTALVPDTVVVPPPSVPSEPIAPLEPASSAPPKRKGRH